MRKLLLALFAMFVMAGLVIAADVTVVKFDKDKKEITVKDGDAEKTYKYTDKLKVTTIDKDDKKTEGKLEDFEKRAGGKGGKGGVKLTITTEKDVITEASWKSKGK